MKDIKNFINESQSELTVKDWQLLGAIVNYLRGDLKHNLEDIRKKEDLKALYTKISNEYQKLLK
jgi:hypothetical protein